MSRPVRGPDDEGHVLCSGNHGRRILVLDDHQQSRTIACLLLRAAGHTCEPVTSVMEALMSLDSFKPDVLIYECHRRAGDGLGLARQLRSRAPGLQIIVTSALDEPEGFAAREPIDAYLTKPFSLIELGALLGTSNR